MRHLLYILIVALAFGLGWCSRSPTIRVRTNHDTIQSEPIVITKVEVDTLYMLSPLPYLAWVDKTDTIILDGRTHPREYKEYRDSTYYAKVSGISPRLEEVRIYPKTVYETHYVYRDIHHKPKRWGLGLSAGYGIGKNGFSPMLALTVNYNLLQW